MEIQLTEHVEVHHNMLRILVELYASLGDKTYNLHSGLVPNIPVPVEITSLCQNAFDYDTTQYFLLYKEWLDSLKPEEKIFKQTPSISRFVTVPENFNVDDVMCFILDTYDPDTWVTLDDILVQPNHLKLLSSFMKNKPKFSNDIISTHDINDLIESSKLKLPAERYVVDQSSGRIIDVKTGTISIGRNTTSNSGVDYDAVIFNRPDPASGTGTLTSMSFKSWGTNNVTEVYIGTCYDDSDATHFTSRDYLNLGTVAVSTNPETHVYDDVDVDVTVGDFPFCSFVGTSGGICRDGLADGCYYSNTRTVPFTNRAGISYATVYAVWGSGTESGTTYRVSASDGIKTGESMVKGSLTVGFSLTDGLKGGDEDKGGLFFSLSLTDGLKGGDSNNRAYTAKPAAADGTKISETPSTLVKKYPSLIDGIKVSDAMLAGLAKVVLAGDGLKLREGDYQTVYGSQQTLTLRPNADASVECTPYGDSYNYLCVDESSTDDDSTYVYHTVGSPQYWYDLYDLPACGLSGVVIDSVIIFSRCRSTSSGVYKSSYYPIRLKTHGVTYTPLTFGEEYTWTNYNYTYTNNPYTGSAWTVEEIDALQVGVGLYTNMYNGYSRCTQIYIEVKYRTVTTGYFPVAVLGKLVSILDGVKAGDSTIAGRLFQKAIVDGLTLSELLLHTKGIGLSATDELKVNDLLTLTQKVHNLLAADGLELSDLISMPGVALLILAITSKYRDVQPITTKYRNAEIINALYRLIKAITSGG